MRDDAQVCYLPILPTCPPLRGGRLLVRHAGLEEAMGPLLGLLADRGALSGGVAALAMFDDGEVRIAAVDDPADAALAGRRVELGTGLLGKSSPRPAQSSRRGLRRSR